MSDPIVSHVANQAYRDHVDEMTCKADGCGRWRTDDRTPFCTDHEPIGTTIDRMNDEGAIKYSNKRREEHALREQAIAEGSVDCRCKFPNCEKPRDGATVLCAEHRLAKYNFPFLQQGAP